MHPEEQKLIQKNEKDNDKKYATTAIALTAATSATGVTAMDTDTVIAIPSGAAFNNNSIRKTENYSKTEKVNNKNTTTPTFSVTGVFDHIGTTAAAMDTLQKITIRKM